MVIFGSAAGAARAGRRNPPHGSAPSRRCGCGSSAIGCAARPAGSVLRPGLRTRCRRAGRRNSRDTTRGGIRRRSRAAGRRAPAGAIASVDRVVLGGGQRRLVDLAARETRGAGRAGLPAAAGCRHARRGKGGTTVAPKGIAWIPKCAGNSWLRMIGALDPPPRFLPVRVAQAPLEDLADFLARQRVGELDHARHLEVGDALLAGTRAPPRARSPRRSCGCTCAASASPNSASGMPNTAQSATSGMVISTASISAG